MKAQRRSKLQLYSFFRLGAKWGRVVNATHTLATLSPGMTGYTLCYVGWG